MKNFNEDVNKELEDLSPLLSKLKHQDDGFKLPALYFEELQDKVWDAIKADEAEEIVVANKPAIRHRKRIWEILFQPQFVMIAASVLVVLIIGVRGDWFGSSNSIEGQAVLADIKETEIEAYINNHIDEFDMDLFVNVGLEETDVSIFDALEEEDLENYMDEILEEIELDELEDLL